METVVRTPHPAQPSSGPAEFPPGYSQLGDKISAWAAVRETLSPVNGYPAVAAFHVSFPKFALAQGSCGIVPFCVAFALAPAPLRIWFALSFAFKLSCGCLAGSWIVSRHYPILVSGEGIRARNPAGVAYRLRWDEIAEVKLLPWSVFSQFARIGSHKKKHAIWLPLFLTDMESFTRTVAQCAPQENPLRQFLEQRQAVRNA